ncbi:hypothetical protein FQZ97_1215510 [compost metagenome]
MVGDTRRVVRCSSFTPNCASSAWSWPETVVFGIARASAARVKLPSSTMRQKARIASSRSKAMIVWVLVQWLLILPIYLENNEQYSGSNAPDAPTSGINIGPTKLSPV